MRRKHALGFAAAIILYCGLLGWTGLIPGVPLIHVVYGADAYGNDITFILVEQWDGAAYQVISNFTSTGGSSRVSDSLKIRFTVGVKLSSSLASSQNEAGNWTDVKMNITNGGAIWTNRDFPVNSKTGPTGGFYYVRFVDVWDDSGKPAAGVTYTCTAKYTAYI